MTNPIMQKPNKPAIEACICCGMAPPVTPAVCDVVALMRFVGTVAVVVTGTGGMLDFSFGFLWRTKENVRRKRAQRFSRNLWD